MYAKFNKFVSTGIFILLVLSLFTQAVQAADQFSLEDYDKIYSQGGVEIYGIVTKKESTYIQKVDLSAGASIEVLANVGGNSSLPGVFGGKNKKFKFSSIRSFWNQAGSKKVCVSNASFYNGDRSITQPLKVNGQVLTEGFQTENVNREAMVLLRIWPDRADIVPATAENFYQSSAPTIIGGLDPYQGKKGYEKRVSRTMVGTDGKQVYIISKSGTQKSVAKELESLGASQVIMFDGGGSSKIICRSGIYKGGEEDRLIPDVIVSMASREIVEGEQPSSQTAPEPTAPEQPEEPQPPAEPTEIPQPTETPAPQPTIGWGFLSPFNNSNPLGVYSTREFDGPKAVKGEKVTGYLHWVDDGQHIPGVDLSNGKGATLYNTCPQGGTVTSGIDAWNVGNNANRYIRIDCGGVASGWQVIFFHVKKVYKTGWAEAGEAVGEQSNHTHYSVGYTGSKKDLPCAQYRSAGRWWIDPSECLYEPAGVTSPVPEITEVVEPSQEVQPTEVAPQQTESPQPQSVETQVAEMDGEVLPPDFNDVKEPSSPIISNGFVFPTPDAGPIKVENLPPDQPPSVMGISESVWRASDLNKILMVLHAIWGLLGVYFTLRGFWNAVAFRLGMLIVVGFFLLIPVLYIPEWNTQGIAYAMAYEPRQSDQLDVESQEVEQPIQEVVTNQTQQVEQSVPEGEIPVPVPPDFVQSQEEQPLAQLEPTQIPEETQVSQEIEIPETQPTPTEEVSSQSTKKVEMPQVPYVELPGDFEPPSPEGCAEFSEFDLLLQRWCTWINQYSQEASLYWMQNGYNVTLRPRLVAVVMRIESRGEIKAYSGQGAVGLLQIMASDGISGTNWPEIFKDRPTISQLENPRFNVQWGTMYLAYKYAKYGDWRKALKSYGPSGVGYLYADCVLEINDTGLSALDGSTCRALFNR